MSELTPLREAVDALAGRSPSPDFGELERRATRRRRRRVVSVAATVASIAVAGGLAAGSLGGSDQVSPVGDPTTPPSESPTVQQTEAPPTSAQTLGRELHAILDGVPGWDIPEEPDYTGYDYAFNGPCAGTWTDGSISGSDGGAPSPAGEKTYAGIGSAGFPSEARAADAAARFVVNLGSCSATAWRTQQLARAGAVLASSPDGVAWIQQTGPDVRVLQVPTSDGPPPRDVQLQVADWLVDYNAWQNSD